MCEIQMDQVKNGMSIRCPCRLDGTNYSYWRIHMSVFIESLGFQVWQSIETGLSILTKTDNGKSMIKPISE